MTEEERIELIEHFQNQIDIAEDYIELKRFFNDIDIVEFICLNNKVIEKLERESK